jgi:hypothetical protein
MRGDTGFLEPVAAPPDATVNPKHTTIEQHRVTASTLLKVTLAPGGVVAVRFPPAR